MNCSFKPLADLNIGYLSLALCILTTKTVDEALEEIAPDPDVDHRLIRIQENEDILNLREKEGLTWPKIGEIFNITYNDAWRRAQRYRDSIRPDKENIIPDGYFKCITCGNLVSRHVREKHYESNHQFGIRKKGLS